MTEDGPLSNAVCTHPYWQQILMPYANPDEGAALVNHCPDCGAQWFGLPYPDPFADIKGRPADA